MPNVTLVDSNQVAMGLFGGDGAVRVQIYGNGSAAATLGVGQDALGNNIAGLVAYTRANLFNGATWDRQAGDVNGTVTQPALSATFWNYAPPVGGIVNSVVAVTVKAAAGAGIRNYISSLQLSADALGAATEFAIRDGAAGTVLARIKVNTAGIVAGGTIRFNPPLRGTANTLVEIITLTASITGGVFANVQGYTGV